MDEQRGENTARDAAGKVMETVSDLAARTQANVQGQLNQGRAGFQDLKATAGDAMERATSAARDMTAAGTQAAAQAGEVIQGVARDVGNQASQTASALYQQGATAGGYLSRYAAEQPLTALLLAVGFGYALAYMIHRP